MTLAQAINRAHMALGHIPCSKCIRLEVWRFETDMGRLETTWTVSLCGDFPELPHNSKQINAHSLNDAVSMASEWWSQRQAGMTADDAALTVPEFQAAAGS